MKQVDVEMFFFFKLKSIKAGQQHSFEIKKKQREPFLKHE